METSLKKMTQGYQLFKEKYATGDESIMKQLADQGQKPEVMVIACCDSRVDPSLILQCQPGDLFTVRNVANIIPPYEPDAGYHGTSAALEFGICYLHVKHLIIFGHSQCGGIQALLNKSELIQNDFIGKWVSLINLKQANASTDDIAKHSLLHSYHNCLTFPWIKERVQQNQLQIHRWFFDIKEGTIFQNEHSQLDYKPLI